MVPEDNALSQFTLFLSVQGAKACFGSEQVQGSELAPQ